MLEKADLLELDSWNIFAQEATGETKRAAFDHLDRSKVGSIGMGDDQI